MKELMFPKLNQSMSSNMNSKSHHILRLISYLLGVSWFRHVRGQRYSYTKMSVENLQGLFEKN